MRKIIIAILTGTVILTACGKKKHITNDKDALVHITVVDEKGAAQPGTLVMIFDEAGYEKFKSDRKTMPYTYTQTLPNGQVDFHMPYAAWFTKGSQQISFVILEEIDADNYHLWAATRTIKAGQKLQITFKLDRSLKAEESGTAQDPEENGPTAAPDAPTENSGTMLEMFDEENGHTLLANAVFLDLDHCFDGTDRYTIADAGQVAGLDALTELTLNRAARRISVWPKHGYFIVKDISLMEFPSGKRAMAIGSQYARIYVTERIVRNNKNVGVKLFYDYQTLEAGDLPQWGRVYEVKLTSDRSVSIPLPTHTADTECVPWGNTPLRVSFSKDQVTIQITDPKASVGNEYRFVIRADASYTEAKLKIVD